MSSKTWADKNIADLLDQAVIDSIAAGRLLELHLKKLDIIARKIVDERIKNAKDLERIRESLRKTAESLRSAHNALKSKDRSLY